MGMPTGGEGPNLGQMLIRKPSAAPPDAWSICGVPACPRVNALIGIRSVPVPFERYLLGRNILAHLRDHLSRDPLVEVADPSTLAVSDKIVGIYHRALGRYDHKHCRRFCNESELSGITVASQSWPWAVFQ